MRKIESFRRSENKIIMKPIHVNKYHMVAYLSMMVLLSNWTYTISCTPQRSFISVPAVAASSHSFIKSSLRTQTIIKSVQIFRGGSHVMEDSDEEEEEEEDTEEEEEEDHSLSSREEPTMDTAEEDNDHVLSSPSSSSSVRNTTPIKVTVKTGLNTPLIDQTWESTCSRTRTIASLKQSLARQMRGRPPVHTQRLLHNGVLLTDDAVILDALVQEQEEEEEEEQNINDDNEHDEENMVTLQLILDTPPPTDTKFATDYADMLSKMTKKELLDAYAINMAASNYMAQNYLLASSVSPTGEEEDPKIITATTTATTDAKESVTVTVRKNALLLKEQLLSSFSEEHRRSIEEDTRTEEEQHLLEEEELKRRRRKGISSTSGGATTNVKVLLQRNLNVDWPDTIRNTLLLLFFGWFGASSPLSQMFLLTAAPLCILLQVRPVKVILKQLFYAIGTPPAIILSLLPAPQQAIMSLNYDLVLKELYGIPPTKPTSTTAGSNSSTELQTEEDDEQQQISMSDDEEELDEDENSIEDEEEFDEEALKEEEEGEEEEEEVEDGDEYEG